MDKNEIFITKARKVHGDKYDYSKVEYVRTHDKVKIICAKHGEFEQAPSSHSSGAGCSKCKGFGFIYLSHQDMVIFLRKLNLKSEQDYHNWWDKNKPDFLPKTLDQYYRNL